MFLLYSIFLFLNSGRLSSGFHFTNETDRQALLAIKDGIQGDPFGVFSSWNNSLPFCQWQGVTCGPRYQRVRALTLLDLQLVGALSPHIGNLSFLRSIDMQNNSLHGGIPQEVGRLFRLRSLYLGHNYFNGKFPINVTQCLELEVLGMNQNNLGGKVPDQIGSLPKLYALGLDFNSFFGTIPPAIGNLSALGLLYLGTNNLEGEIPIELGKLSELEDLQLGSNMLTGTILPALWNISTIQEIALAENQLHGTLPSYLGLSLPKLELIYMGGNQLSGVIPASLTNASGLGIIDLPLNAFTGDIPPNLGNLQKLEVLNLGGNLLGAEKANDFYFLNSLINCSNLRVINLYHNRLAGKFPDAIANLSSKLTQLWLGQNYISGSIPTAVGNLVNIQFLDLSENQLNDTIPRSLGKLIMLEHLDLFANNFSGNIPSAFSNMSRLSLLGLSHNMLEGTIPASLGDCIMLQELVLSHNNLSGIIPGEVVGLPSLTIGVSLADNFLTGPLPLQVGNMKNLMLLDVARNQLSGNIPSTLGDCVVLQHLDMAGNLFEGTIPSSFEKLKGLQVLNLSHNNLSGKIPSFLGGFSALQDLSLSYNIFEGEVPTEGVFTNISAFSVVGNNKLCGGVEGLQLPACPAKVLKKRKKPFSNRVIISLVTALAIVPVLLLCLLAIFQRTRRSKRQASLTSPFPNPYPQLSYAELLQATDGFSSANLIGEGTFGSVFKGILNTGAQIVAVKVLNIQQVGANKSFMAECEALRIIRHRNLVKIVTSCSSIDHKGNDFKALVFEFMANGSLESWLHPSLSEKQQAKKLNLVQRLRTSIDVASALDYLHHDCGTVIIHCDLKPSNVLLDDDLCAQVGDFGLARILSTTSTSNHQQSSSIGIRGTIGYVAPEYGMGGEISTQGDMYSFGVLLLEMFTGKRPTDSNDITLRSYAKMFLPGRVMEIVDPRIIQEEEEKSSAMRRSRTNHIAKVKVCLASIMRIGVSCSAEHPNERMDARDALAELRKIRDVFLGTRNECHSAG